MDMTVVSVKDNATTSLGVLERSLLDMGLDGNEHGATAVQGLNRAPGGRPPPSRKAKASTVFTRCRTYKLVKDVHKYGITSTAAKTIPFEQLSTRLRDTSVIKTMKLLLHRVCVLTAEGVRTCPGSEETKNVNVRVFLASFMIAYRSTNVFESMHKRENDLQVAAIEMLKVFDMICYDIYKRSPAADSSQAVKKAINFPGVLHNYLKAFQTWKIADEAKLTARIKHALNALYQAESHLVNTPLIDCNP
jgi:hypothetical protein